MQELSLVSLCALVIVPLSIIFIANFCYRNRFVLTTSMGSCYAMNFFVVDQLYVTEVVGREKVERLLACNTFCAFFDLDQIMLSTRRYF